jgi:hypothetical protein
MTFSEYLTQKNIDAVAFAQAEPGTYADWEQLFGQVHPESFTLQKKFLINDVRRRHQLRKEVPAAGGGPAA